MTIPVVGGEGSDGLDGEVIEILQPLSVSPQCHRKQEGSHTPPARFLESSRLQAVRGKADLKVTLKSL